MERKTRIILFDDDQNITQCLQQVLKRKGYEVFIYHDPSLCPLQHSHNCQCEENEQCADIVITDIDMPNVSGLHFIDDQVGKGCKIQNIAIMSGRWSEQNIKHANALGCKIFEKPFNISNLLEWIGVCEEQIDQASDLCNWFLQEKDNLSAPPRSSLGQMKRD
jgi:DNA-binding response OmpR family regulator